MGSMPPLSSIGLGGSSNNNSGLSAGTIATGLGGLGDALSAAGGSTASSNQKTSGTSTVTPNLSPLQQSLMNSILGASGNLLNGINLSGYQATGDANILNQGIQGQNALQQTLAQRGLIYSPLAEAETINNQQNTGNQLSTFNNSIPILQQQLAQGALSSASGALSSTPFGTTTNQTGTIQSTGSTGTGVAGQVGAGISGAGSIIGLLAGIGLI